MRTSPTPLPQVPDVPVGGNGQPNPWQGLLDVLQAFHRWQHGPTDHQLLQDFFQGPAQGLGMLQRDFPPHRHLLIQRALPACLPGWRQAFATSGGGYGCPEAVLRHMLPPSGAGTRDVAMGGHLGFEGPHGERLMVRVELECRIRMQEVSSLTLIAPTDQVPGLRALLERMEVWMEANPHLRGAKLDAQGEFLRLGRAYTWEDIVLAPSIRAAVERHVVQFFEWLPRYQAFGLPAKRGVLLVGPPGTGKTLLGKVLCSLLPSTFLWVSPGEIVAPADVQRLFALARECQPTILFLEDLDLYASRRGSRGGEGLLGELLNQLDGFPNNSGVLTLATTNDPRAIEPALADRPSRFDHHIRLDPPKGPERQVLLTRFLRAHPHPSDSVPDLVAATEGFTGAHLQEVVHLAVQRALDDQRPGEDTPPALDLASLREAVRRVRQQRGSAPGHYA